jgi:hypothetical protein
LSKVLRNESVLGSTEPSLDELLTLKQRITGEEPDIVTFELPIRYDAVTNIGMLEALVDAPSDHPYGSEAARQDCERATNGDSLLIWNTTYDPPGQHAVQARFSSSFQGIKIRGPVFPFFSSNICQFSPFFSDFGSRGAVLYAKLPESNATFSIELKSSEGLRLRTLSGVTTNGEIRVPWDLTDDHGNHCTNESFESVFHVTLTSSGRSETMKGR